MILTRYIREEIMDYFGIAAIILVIVWNIFGNRVIVGDKGYFLAKRRYISKHQYKKKISMKKSTKRMEVIR